MAATGPGRIATAVPLLGPDLAAGTGSKTGRRPPDFTSLGSHRTGVPLLGPDLAAGTGSKTGRRPPDFTSLDAPSTNLSAGDCVIGASSSASASEVGLRERACARHTGMPLCRDCVRGDARRSAHGLGVVGSDAEDLGRRQRRLPLCVEDLRLLGQEVSGEAWLGPKGKRTTAAGLRSPHRWSSWPAHQGKSAP